MGGKKTAQTSLLDEIIVDNFAGGGGASTGIELACGKPVAPCYLPNKRLSSKRYHEDCIINSAIQSIVAGTKTMKADPALKRAVSHGFTRTELLKIMEERNVENDRT